jgi:hypothetical protein
MGDPCQRQCVPPLLSEHPAAGGSRDFRDFVIEFAVSRLPDLG